MKLRDRSKISQPKSFESVRAESEKKNKKIIPSLKNEERDDKPKTSKRSKVQTVQDPRKLNSDCFLR